MLLIIINSGAAPESHPMHVVLGLEWSSSHSDITAAVWEQVYGPEPPPSAPPRADLPAHRLHSVSLPAGPPSPSSVGGAEHLRPAQQETVAVLWASRLQSLSQLTGPHAGATASAGRLGAPATPARSV